MIRSPCEGRYSSQPDLSTGSTDISSHVTTRKRKPSPDMQDLLSLKEEIGGMLDSIKTNQDNQTKKLQESVYELHAQNKEIIKTNSNIEKILLQTTTLYNDLKVKCDELTIGHNEAKLRICALEEQIEEMQRSQRKATLEIRNIPETENENLEEVINKVHSSLGIPDPVEHVTQIRRIKNNKNKVIVVEYANVTMCSRVLKALKQYNNTYKEDKFSTETMNLTGEKVPIFISESLTPAARKLHYLARGLRKHHGYNHCWTWMGRVYVRYREGYPAIHIKSIQQVESLKISPANISPTKNTESANTIVQQSGPYGAGADTLQL